MVLWLRNPLVPVQFAQLLITYNRWGALGQDEGGTPLKNPQSRRAGMGAKQEEPSFLHCHVMAGAATM